MSDLYRWHADYEDHLVCSHKRIRHWWVIGRDDENHSQCSYKKIRHGWVIGMHDEHYLECIWKRILHDAVFGTDDLTDLRCSRNLVHGQPERVIGMDDRDCLGHSHNTVIIVWGVMMTFSIPPVSLCSLLLQKETVSRYHRISLGSQNLSALQILSRFKVEMLSIQGVSGKVVLITITFVGFESSVEWRWLTVRSCMVKKTSQGIGPGPAWKFVRVVMAKAAWRQREIWFLVVNWSIPPEFSSALHRKAVQDKLELVRSLTCQNPAPALEQSFMSLLIVYWSATDFLSVKRQFQCRID